MMKWLLKLFVFSLFLWIAASSLAQSGTTLQLFVERDSLTLYVASGPLWLGDLEFRTLNSQGVVQSVRLGDGFDVLKITGGYADTGTCFVYTLSGATPPLPDACSQPNRVFRRDVTRADVFWYDFVTNRARTVSVFGSGVSLMGELCSPDLPNCPLSWNVIPSLTPSPTEIPIIPPTPPPSPTPTDPLQAAYAQAAAYDYRQGNAVWLPIYQTFDDVEMVLVPPGCFDMGSEDGNDDEKPAHQQCFDRPFWIDKYEVTNAQYKRCVEAGECKPPGDRKYYDDPAYADHPVVYVNWYYAKKYAEWRGGALPTEREWEYAARGPDDLEYPWGNEFIADNVVYSRNSNGKMAAVGSRPGGAAWVGALDLSGNVWEWVSSAYKNYPYQPDDRREDLDGTDISRVLRGGSWNYDVHYARCASRGRDDPSIRYGNRGFRVVVGVPVS